MSDVIHLLPDTVANQIAAGEVVQQASSIIKELVENAVDAGADRVEIYVTDYGKTQIQVVDNGKGMSETDARMAFERHATSKITRVEDVFNLHTMGFRGEALPSIAAVAHVTLRTRQADQQLGTKLRIEGGKYVSQEKDMCPVGTSFSVSNLFFNYRARRAHLLNHVSAEYRNILQEFERMALVNPSVSFQFQNNGTLVHDLPATNVLQRIIGLFGKKVYSRLLPVKVETSICNISGYVGRPDMARKKGALQYFFTNGRFMRHGFFHKAVCEAFADLVPDGEQVPYFLYFDVDPSTIDVNIHPTKTEINFQQKQAIWPIIVSAIKEALGKFNVVPPIVWESPCSPDAIPVYNPARQAPQEEPEIKYDDSFDPFSSAQALSSTLPQSSVRPYPGGLSSSVGGTFAAAGSCADPKPSGRVISAGLGLTGDADYVKSPVSYAPLPDFQTETVSEGVQQELYVNDSYRDMERSSEYYQYRGQYIMTAVRSGLMMVDQHRAHVRVLYNRYRDVLSGQPSVTQGLAFPDELRLSASDAALLDSIQEEVRCLGFDLASVGEGVYEVRGVPAFADNVDPVALLGEILESLRDTGKNATEDIHHKLALAMARRSAMQVGEVLTRQKMEALVGDLFATDNPSFGPDGKTVLVILPQENIDRMFR